MLFNKFLRYSHLNEPNYEMDFLQVLHNFFENLHDSHICINCFKAELWHYRLLFCSLF